MKTTSNLGWWKCSRCEHSARAERAAGTERRANLSRVRRAALRGATARSASRSTSRLGAVRPTLLLAVLALAFVGGAIFFFTRQHSTPSASTAPPELHRTNLVLTAGHWHRRGETNSFTGVLLDTYDDGAKKSRTEISHGLPHGVSLGWHTNGQPQVEEHFLTGTSHGLRTKWHAHGQKLSEVNVAHGKLEGTFRRWDERGARAEEIEMRDGQPDGLSRAWFPSGCLKAEATLRAGKVITQSSWPDGERPAGG